MSNRLPEQIYGDGSNHFKIDQNILYVDDNLNERNDLIFEDFTSKWFKDYFRLTQFDGYNYNVINLRFIINHGPMKDSMRSSLSIKEVDNYNIFRLHIHFNHTNVVQYPLMELRVRINPLLQLLNMSDDYMPLFEKQN